MRDKPLILVTGATGAVGPRVVVKFLESGCRVRTFSLDKPQGQWPDHVDEQIGDITDSTAVQSAMQGIDAVVHLAALLHMVNPPPEMRKKYEHINIGGTTTVVDAAIRAGAKRVVLFSTIAVYGASNGSVLDEQSVANPDTFYAQTKLAAEQIILNAKIKDGQQPLGCVLRLGAVYGSRIKGNYERLTHALARHRFIPIGKGFNRRTLIYDKDVAQAAVLAASHPAAAGCVFNVTDGQFHALNEIIKSICLALGRKPPRVSLPLGFSCRIADLIEKTSWAMGIKLPAIRTMIDKYNEDVSVDGSLMKKELGFVPQYDLITGWDDAIKEMRNLGYL